MNHERLVSQRIIEDVRRDLYDQGLHSAVKHLIDIEPELWDSIVVGTSQINERLIKAGVDDTIRNDIYVTARWTSVVAVEALRRGHYRLWCGTHIGTLLEQMDPTLRDIGESQ
jgi:hypothetical protein